MKLWDRLFRKRPHLVPLEKLSPADIKALEREAALAALRQASEALDVPVEDLTLRKARFE